MPKPNRSRFVGFTQKPRTSKRKTEIETQLNFNGVNLEQELEQMADELAEQQILNEKT